MSAAGDDLDRAIEEAISPRHDAACFGCGADNPAGLHLPWDAVDDAAGTYAAPLVLAERHQGGPGLAHGGVVAAALDEAMGILAAHVAFPAVTARIEVKFRRPVPTGTELRLSAHLRRRAGRQLFVDAALEGGGEVLAEASGVFLQVSLRHFLGTPEGRAEREAWRRRLGADAPPEIG